MGRNRPGPSRLPSVHPVTLSSALNYRLLASLHNLPYIVRLRFLSILDMPGARMPLKCILLVDDSPTVRLAVCRMFEANGYRICGEAENGKEAIEKSRAVAPGFDCLGPVHAGDERA